MAENDQWILLGFFALLGFLGFLAWLKSQQPATATLSLEEVRRVREEFGRR
jgi:hypothetical protein